MQAIPALFATLSAGAGTAAATAGVAGAAATAGTVATAAAAASTGATFAGAGATLLTGLKVAGTVAGLASSIGQANYTASVASRNAVIAERNAAEAVENSQRENQQRGLAAAVEMGDLLAGQSASGLNLGSGSYALARKSQAALAAQDSQIVAETGARQARNYMEQASGFRSDGQQALGSKKFSVAAAGLQIGTSLVSDAAKVNRKTAKKYN